MKNLIYILVFLVSAAADGQTITENYVETTTYQVPTTTGTSNPDNKITSTTYYDGLGRPMQSISVQAGGDRENIVSYQEYDQMGLQPKQYLPWASTTGASTNYIDPTTLQANISTFYNAPKYENTTNPYSEISYERSPLFRTNEQGAPGDPWAVNDTLDTDHTIKFEYLSNGASEVLQFSVNFIAGNTLSPSLVHDGFYGVNELFKTVTKDENWKVADGNDHTVQEFTDKSGQLVLKRTFNNSVAHDTYYVYDSYDNLTYVLSPEASEIIINQYQAGTSQQVLDDLGYQYKYDFRNRLIWKKIPGKGYEFIAYNKLNQPILTQDALQRTTNEWSFTKYDHLGRVVYTGLTTISDTRENLENNSNSATAIYETRGSILDVGGTDMYYSNDAYPSSGLTVLTVSYYDDYVDTAGMNVPTTTSLGTYTSNELQGLPTVSKVRVLGINGPLSGATAWITTIIGYDDKGQSIYGETDNPYLDTSDVSESLLDFTGKPTETLSSHTKAALPSIETRDYSTYDHMGRLLTHHQKIDTESVQLIAENQYDELGQLIQKSVGGDSYVDGYTDITNADVTAQGYIVKNTAANGWDSGAKTRGEILGDGGIRFTVVHGGSRHYKVGLVDTGGSNNDGWGDFDFAIFIRGDGTVDLVWGNTIIASGITTYVVGDIFSVVRQGTLVYFRKGAAVLGSAITFNDTSTLTGKIGLYTYNSEVSDVQLVGLTDQILQDIDYKYNIRGWLTDINDVDFAGFKDPDLFNFRINYNTVEGNATNNGNIKLLYNGNIAQTIWKTANTDSEKKAYAYGYDDLSRITLAYNKKGNLLDVDASNNLNNVLYDKNGNIEGLTRRGKAENTGTYPLWDDLTYTYSGNQLQGVVDSAPATDKHLGFNDGNNGSSDFTYDVNGNMTVDNNKGIASISYNHLNLPTSVVFGSSGQISYIYDATGVKLRKIVTQTAGGQDITSYAGSYVYLGNTLQFISQPEGYIEPIEHTSGPVKGSSGGTTTYSAYNYIFQYKDHLGNIRLSYGDSDKNGVVDSSEIIEESHYYPFGLKQKGYNYIVNGGNSLAQQWKFGGKQYQEELDLNWYDVSARNYDPAIGRWMNVDPLAEKMRRHSPYNYAFNSPVYFVDYDGMAPTGSQGPCGRKPCPDNEQRVKDGFDLFFEGIGIAMTEYFRSQGFSLGIAGPKPSEEKSNDEVIATHENAEEKINEGGTNVVRGGTQLAADEIKDVAEMTSMVSSAITVASGGATLPLTGPVSKIADYTAGGAGLVSASIDFLDGNHKEGLKKVVDAGANTVVGATGKKLGNAAVKNFKKASDKIYNERSKAIIEITVSSIWEAIKLKL